jgi:glycosyltransferase involved in cell wall biosynthesis
LPGRRDAMINGKKVVVVLPAFNAEKTLAKTVAEIDRDMVDEVILVDDASRDNTVEEAERLGIRVVRHPRNMGYGANQKTCYREALRAGADIVVMVHPDYQYTPKLIVSLASMVAYEVFDFVIGSRILGPGAMKGGMPWWKYVANRFLTLVENKLVGFKLSEYHSGYRAFSSEVISRLRLDENSDDFVFDNQMIVQALAAGFRIGELSCPARYEADSSSVNFFRSVVYGVGVLRTGWQYWLHRHGLRRYPYLVPRDDHSGPEGLSSG